MAVGGYNTRGRMALLLVATLLAVGSVQTADAWRPGPAWLSRPNSLNHWGAGRRSPFEVFGKDAFGFGMPTFPHHAARHQRATEDPRYWRQATPPPQPPVVRERAFEVRDAGDRFEIHIAAQERSKNGLFAFDVNWDDMVLSIKDRADERAFNQRFQLPAETAAEDLLLRPLRDRVVVTVMKHAPSATTAPGFASSPQPAEDREEEARIEPAPETKPRQTVAASPGAAQPLAATVDIDDGGLVVEDVDVFDEPADSAPGAAAEGDVSDGYYDNRGTFHHY